MGSQRVGRDFCFHFHFPLDSKEIKPVSLNGVKPEYSLEGLMMKLKLQYFGHLMQTDDSLEKSLMLGKIEGRRRRGHQRMRWLDGIIEAMNMNLGKLWEIVRTGRPGMLQSMGSQRVRHDWATAQQQAGMSSQTKELTCKKEPATNKVTNM